MKNLTERKVRIICIILAAVMILKGCSDTLAMRNCFYVLIPYIVEVLMTFIIISQLIRVYTSVRQENVRKGRQALQGLTLFLFVFALAGIAALIVFLVLNGAGDTGAWQYPLLFAADAVAAAAGFILKKGVKSGQI